MHHLWLIKYDTRIITNMLRLNNCVLGPSRHVRAYYRMPLFSPDFLFSDPFGHETFRLLLRCLPLAGVDTESSAIAQKISHPLFFLPPHAARAPTKSPNIAHFGSLVSSMRATNPANSIRLLRIIASVLSLPAFMNVSRYEIRWSMRLFFRQPMQRVRKLWWARRSVPQWHARGLYVTQPYSIVSSTSALRIPILSSPGRSVGGIV